MINTILLTAFCTSIATFIATVAAFLVKNYYITARENKKHYIATLSFFHFILTSDKGTLSYTLKNTKNDKCVFVIVPIPLTVSLGDIETFCAYNYEVKELILGHILDRKNLLDVAKTMPNQTLDKDKVQKFFNSTIETLAVVEKALKPKNIDKALQYHKQ